jgi:hypothetical protein
LKAKVAHTTGLAKPATRADHSHILLPKNIHHNKKRVIKLKKNSQQHLHAGKKVIHISNGQLRFAPSKICQRHKHGKSTYSCIYQTKSFVLTILTLGWTSQSNLFL